MDYPFQLVLNEKTIPDYAEIMTVELAFGLTSDGGASDGDAIPDDGGASPSDGGASVCASVCASGGPSAPLRA
jgi:hypothetical protein